MWSCPAGRPTAAGQRRLPARGASTDPNALVPGKGSGVGYPDAAFRGLHAEYSPVVLRLVTVLTGGDRRRAEDVVLLAHSRIRTRLGWALYRPGLAARALERDGLHGYAES